jgi:hypothetical protein
MKAKPLDMPLENLAEEALKEAVAEVIAEHKLAGYPLAVWKDGRIFHLSADQIEVRERPAKYKLSPRSKFIWPSDRSS